MMNRLLSEISASEPALILADAALKATVLLAGAVVAALVLRRASAAARHRLWGLAMAGLLAVVPLSWAVPGWGLPVVAPAAAIGPAPGVEAAVEMIPGERPPASAVRPTEERDATAVPHPAVPERPRLVPDLRTVDALGLAWALGALLAGGPAFVGIVRNAIRRRRSPEIADAEWAGLLGGLAGALGIRRRVELRASPAAAVPVTWGVFRPVILVPASGLGWPEPMRRVVLLHELAHVARRDVGFLMIGRLAASAFWFHPLAWYALRRLRIECEHAADDLVVRAGVPRTDYAGKLVELARSLRGTPPAMAVPMARKTTLEHRVMAIFDDGRSHRPLGVRPALALFGGAMVVLAGLAACRLEPSATGQQAEPDAPPPQIPNPAVPTHPITVTGRAVDPEGKPVAGAEIYLASRTADFRRLAETTTDEEGRYEFRDVPLPIQKGVPVSDPTSRDFGYFQIFGRAEGFSFAWDVCRIVWPYPRPASIPPDPPGTIRPNTDFEPDEPINLTTKFRPEARLSGRIVDEQGRPIADAQLVIWDGADAKEGRDDRWSFDAMLDRDTVPASMRSCKTDAEGRFTFTGLPRETVLQIVVVAPGYPYRWIYAATTREPQPDRGGEPVLSGEIDLVLATPLGVPIQVVRDDTGEPAPRVLVQAAQGPETPLDITDTSGVTDDEGRVTLPLSTGTYRLKLVPEQGAPYLFSVSSLSVEKAPPLEPFVERLRPATILEVKVVDAATGEGLPGATLYRRDGRKNGEVVVSRSWEVGTRKILYNWPETASTGTIRALIEPGIHRLGVYQVIDERTHLPVEPEGKEIDCRAGETVRVEFSMRKTR
jgi:beta-lactamase regulating signal transducer with metallopeptidase domain/protocatechuate 3,4-dioxygenase beta subunit